MNFPEEIDINKFVKCKRISRDSFSVRFQVKDKKTGQFYQAFVYDIDNDQMKERIFKNIIPIMNLANYPTIIKFIGYSKTDFSGEEKTTIITEFVSELSLYDLINKVQKSECPPKYTNTTRQIIMIGIASGIKCLHDLGIIHSDIKPRNILLDENFHPKITGFDVSFFIKNGVDNYGGALIYKAPEIFIGDKYNKEVDIYSFGIMLYEIVTNSPPYPELLNSKFDLYKFQKKIIEDGYRPVFKTPINKKLQKFIEQCWTGNPNERPTIDGVLTKLEDPDYFLDDVDQNEVKLYLKELPPTINPDDLKKKVDELREINEKLHSDNKNQQEKIQKIQEEIAKLRNENKNQQKKIKKIEEENKKLHEDVKNQQKIQEENKKLHEDVKNQQKIQEENKKLHEDVKNQQKEIQNLQKEIKNIKEKGKQSQQDFKILDSDMIKKYKKIEEIASGGGGRIFKVSIDQFYALKEMILKKASTDSLRNFVGEYEIINMLIHPNIIKTYGIFLSDEKTPPCIILEFCPINLETAVENKSLSNEQIVIIIYQIIEGMKYVHHCKIIHRDLKPTNILITDDGTIKICDFGISKLMTLEEQSMTRGLGTQKYMAPEILNEEDDYNEKVDVYSFGVLMFFVISGGQMPKIKLFDIPKGKKAEIPSSFTDFARSLINDCWNLSPDERPSFNEILNRLEKSNFNLVNLSKMEIKNVERFVKQHKSKIPQYSK